MRRRDLITVLGGIAAWPLAARAQQPTLPVIGGVSGRSSDAEARTAAAFHKGLNETGYVDGHNVTVEYHWIAGQYDRLPALMADLVRRQVAVIATTGNLATALAAKAATSTIPIVFGVGQDPVKLGLVASLARPGGTATGINDFLSEVDGKRMRLLHDLLPKAARVAVLVNPANAASAEGALQGAKQAAGGIGLAFSRFAQDRPDPLFIAADAFFVSRAAQFVTLTARDRIPATYSLRDYVVAGGLMSYGADLADIAHQVGVYTGTILKGAKPAELPVLQSTKFNFVLNLQTARALGIEVPPAVLSIAD